MYCPFNLNNYINDMFITQLITYVYFFFQMTVMFEQRVTFFMLANKSLFLQQLMQVCSQSQNGITVMY